MNEIKFNIPRTGFKGFKQSFRQQIKKLVKEEVKEAKIHMKVDGWNLCIDGIKSKIIYKILGSNLFITLIGELLTNIPNTSYIFENGENLLKKNDYIPVSYDSHLNKIVYEFKDTIDGRFTYLGPL